MTDVDTPREEAGLRRGRWWRAFGGGLVLVTVANLLVFGIGAVAGASYGYQDGGQAHQVGISDVAMSTIVPFVLGVGLAVLISRWWRPTLRIAQVVGAVLAVVTVAGPLALDTDTATRVALAAMHVVLGAGVVATLEVIRRARG